MTERQTATEAKSTRQIQRTWPLVSGCVTLLLVAVSGALIALRESAVVPYPVDDGWMDYLMSRRSPGLERIAVAFDILGGGLVAVLVVPVVVATLLWFVRGRWATTYWLTAVILSAALVQLIKNTVDRPRPEEILVHADFGSFPSGHSANAATLATVIGILLHRKWVWFVGVLYVLAMMLSRNYLGAHWLTDTVGGLLLGVAVAIICWAPFAYYLYREREARRSRDSRSASDRGPVGSQSAS